MEASHDIFLFACWVGNSKVTEPENTSEDTGLADTDTDANTDTSTASVDIREIPICHQVSS